MNIYELCELKADALSKMTKAELVTIIDKDGWQIRSVKYSKESLEKEKTEARDDARMAAKLIASWLNEPCEEEVYNNKVDFKCKDLIVLIGRLLAAKGSREDK